VDDVKEQGWCVSYLTCCGVGCPTVEVDGAELCIPCAARALGVPCGVEGVRAELRRRAGDARLHSEAGAA
jgi:hypothetical protein